MDPLNLFKAFLVEWRSASPSFQETFHGIGDQWELPPALPQRISKPFRPNEIVPALYLGAVNDVSDPLLLTRSLLKESSRRGGGEGAGRKHLLRLLVSASFPKHTEFCLQLRHCSPTFGEKDKLLKTFNIENSELNTFTQAEWAAFLEKHLSASTKLTSDKGYVYFRLCIPLLDYVTEDVSQYFRVTNPCIAAALFNSPEETSTFQSAVVVHCMAGVSRSTTILISFLLDTFFAFVATPERRDFLQEAQPALLFTQQDTTEVSANLAQQMVNFCVKFVAEARCFVCPNEGFMKQLQSYTLNRLVELSQSIVVSDNAEKEE